MAVSRASRHTGRRSGRAFIVAVAIAGALLLVSAAVFAIWRSTQQIASHAQALHAADDSLRLATVVRAQLGLAVHFGGIDEQSAGAYREAEQRSVQEAIAAAGEIEPTAADMRLYGGAGEEVEQAATRFVAQSRAVVETLEGDPQAAQAMTATALDATYREFVDLTVAERDRQFSAVADSNRFTSRLGNFALFALALAIPVIFMASYREVVRRQQRQAELEIRLDAERQLGKARDEFVANASHELRTPLTSIYGIGQLLLEDAALSPTAREMVDMIITESADLNRMVEDLLTAARLAAGQLRFEPEDVETAEEAATIVGPFLRSGLDVAVDAEPAVVHVDRLRQRQVLRNLLSNAMKYGGPRIRLEGRGARDWYEWAIVDNGDGVPAELQARLFQRFVHQQNFQQAVAGGVGLGLSIVKALAEGMGGTVSYRRVDGETRFEVRVPVASAVPRTDESEAATTPSVTSHI